ncbi:MAG TPA: porin [Methylophilaceae bacterium]|nr:porin [Methylophilaceae bacterium]
MKSIKLRGVVAAVSGAMLLGALPAMADSNDDIINALMAKGVLTEEEGALLMKGRQGEKEAAEAKKKSEIKASFKDGIVFESGDKAFKMSINGRVQADYRTFHPQQVNNQADTWDIRRAYLGVKGTFYDWIDFAAIANFANTSSQNSSAMYEYYLNLRPVDYAQLQMGQFKQPMSLEELTSSRFINFTERSYAAQLAPGIDRGAMLQGIPVKGTTYAVGYFNGLGSNINSSAQNFNENSIQNDGKAWTGRVTANIAELMGNPDMVAHLGVAYSDSWGNNNTSGTANSTQVTLRSEGRGLDVFKSANLRDGFDLTRTGLEGAFAYNQFKLQSEYAHADYQNDKGLIVSGTATDDSKTIKTWNAALTWLVTGEKYADSYKNGKFDRIKPFNDFNPRMEGGNKGWGAWELGLRYTNLDASDFETPYLAATVGPTPAAQTAKFNEAHAWTAGVKWIINPNTRFLLDYIHTKLDCANGTTTAQTNANKAACDSVDDTENAMNFRAQFDF